ncbi:MAG: metallophosphoesterase [Xanthomonadales bacterium]|nr:metallophosphoesterase [Xanthomonadales bacterium]
MKMFKSNHKGIVSRAILGVCLLLLAGVSQSAATKLNDYHWSGVERVIAIGDLHGDYQQFVKIMQSAGLMNTKGKWTGGKTHLVQTGDITDRGADSRKIIDHLIKLSKQAKKKGGYIHMLIGNHEAMNVGGDLRYVHAGEYAAFADSKSLHLQEQQWQRQLELVQSIDAEAFASLDLVAARSKWEKKIPLGWVEHRAAWATDGEYGKWVLNNPAAIRINETIYLHGGISSKFCRYSLRSLSKLMHEGLSNYDAEIPSIVNDPVGPIWYRGLAQEAEGGVYSQTLDNVLKRYKVKRIVVGHTPTGGIVWPRFDQRVIVNDTGIATYYGRNTGILELQGGVATAIYANQRIQIPESSSERIDYLRAVIKVKPDNAKLKKRLEKLLAPELVEKTSTEEASAEETEEVAVIGTCQ